MSSKTYGNFLKNRSAMRTCVGFQLDFDLKHYRKCNTCHLIVINVE